MSARLQVHRLARLVDELLHPFNGLDSIFLTEDAEKKLLVSLSQILKQINQWKHEFISGELALVKDSSNYTEYLVAAIPTSNCLAKIICSLVHLLGIKNQYAEYLVGSTLFAVCEFLLIIDHAWDDFLILMCYCVKLVIGKCSAQSSELDTSNVSTSHSDLFDAQSLLKLKLNNTSFSTAATLFQVLHKVQKYLKKDSDETMAAYLDYTRTLVSNLPADIFLCTVDRHTDSCKQSGVEAVYVTDSAGLGEETIFVGAFIQLLCSLVTESCFLEARDGCSPFSCKIIGLIPYLASWCLLEPQSGISFRASHYIRHKLLFLMVKLSSSQLEKTILVTWIDLLHKNFEDLILEPIYGVELDDHDDDGFLEGSPFFSSVFNSEKPITKSRHLQRLAAFLFLKCSLSLMSMPDELLPVKGSMNQNSIVNESLCIQCEVRSLGSMKLHQWFVAHAPADIFVRTETCHEWCLQFSLCFLRLYMHEDDILFEVLLLLLRFPLHPLRQAADDEPLLHGKNIEILASKLFNPINLFHLFLSEIFYDHQVLLDYLISKDTGPKCAEYILRSLRYVFDSWKSFTEFPGVESRSRSSWKPQKVSVESHDLMTEESHEKLSDCITSAHENHDEDFEHKRKRQRNSRPPHSAVRHCFASLRRSIDSLNRKKLFPYNPKVLLQRLARFEELCAQA